MDWAAHGNVPLGGHAAAIRDGSYERKRPSNTDKNLIGKDNNHLEGHR
jgi:hypothetical protein